MFIQKKQKNVSDKPATEQTLFKTNKIGLMLILLTIVLVIVACFFVFSKYKINLTKNVEIIFRQIIIPEDDIIVDLSTYGSGFVEVSIHTEEGLDIEYKLGENGVWKVYIEKLQITEDVKIYTRLADGNRKFQETSKQIIVPVASITKESKTTYYETLNKAIDSCELDAISSTEIKMLDNIQENVIINNTQNIILNTNGRTLTSEELDTIINNGTLKIIGNGTISSGTNYIAINNTGTESLTISDGIITGGTHGVYSTSGDITIDGGNIGVTNDTGIGVETVSGKITINDGTVNCGISGIIVEGVVTGATCIRTATGELEMNGGTINAQKIGITKSGGGNITITGGTITSEASTNTIFLENDSEADLIITGGVVSTNAVNSIINSGGGTVTIGTMGDSSTTNPSITGRIYSARLYSEEASEGSVYIHSGSVIGTTRGAVLGYGDIRVTGGLIRSSGGSAAYAIQSNNVDSTIDISGGTIEQTSSFYAVTTLNALGGTINITGGTITSNNLFAVNNYIGTTTISGGTITSNVSRAVNCTTGSVTISDGTITGGTHGVYSTSGDITIDGGSIGVTNNTGIGVETVSGKITINDGEITGGNSGSIANGIVTGAACVRTGTGQIEVNGGTINTERIGIVKSGAGTIKITGGIIKSDVSTTPIYIENESEADLIITGGTILTDKGVAIYNYGGGDITVGTQGDSSIVNPSITGNIYSRNQYSEGGLEGNIYIHSGSVTGIGTGGTGTAVNGYGDVIITGGELKSSTYYVILAGKVIDISGGTIEQTSGSFAVMTSHDSGTKINISGGTIISRHGFAVYCSVGTTTISGGTIKSSYGIAVAGGYGGVNVTGGTIIGGMCGIVNDYGDITIDGGSISVTDDHPYTGLATGIAIQTYSGNIIINDGEIIGGDTNTITLDEGLETGDLNIVVEGGTGIRAETGNIEVNGGTITGAAGIVKSGSGDIVINDGNIYTEETGAILLEKNSEANLEILGGTVSTGYGDVIRNSSIGNIIIGTQGDSSITSPLIEGRIYCKGDIDVHSGKLLSVPGDYPCNIITFGAETIVNITGGEIINNHEYYSISTANLTGGTVNMTGGKILNNGTTALAQGIHNMLGTTNINGGTIIGSIGVRVSTGTVNVTGGSIVGTNRQGVFIESTGTLVIGENEGVPSTTIPSITGDNYGVSKIAGGIIKFYGGVIKGKTGPTSASINEIPTNYYLNYSVDGDYKVVTLLEEGLEQVISNVDGSIRNHPTVQSAVDYIGLSEGTITLQSDVITESVIITSGQNIVLDTNGKTLTSEGSDTITNNGILKIIGNGTISSGTDYIAVNNTGIESVIISDGIITGGTHGVYSTSGDITIDGGSIGVTNNTGIGIQTVSGKITINDGEITGGNSGSIANGIVTGATTIRTTTGEIEVNGGTISTERIGIVKSGAGTIKISGGTVISEFSTNPIVLENNAEADLIITGGAVSTNALSSILNYGGGNVTIGTIGDSSTTNPSIVGRILSSREYSEETSEGKIYIHSGSVTGTTGAAVFGYGDVIVTGGLLRASGTDSAYVIRTARADSTIDISGGTIEQTSGFHAVTTINAIGGTINISGGKITSVSSYAVNNVLGTTTISGGTITSNTSRGVFSTTGSIIISDGTITGGIYGVYSTSGDITIDGGSIGVTNNTGIGVETVSGKITINDGEITGGNSGSIANGIVTGGTAIRTATGQVEVNGGTISTERIGIVKSGVGTVKITKGIVRSEALSIPIVLENDSEADLIITGGTISTDQETAIYNYGGGNITVGTQGDSSIVNPSITGRIYSRRDYSENPSEGKIYIHSGSITGTTRAAVSGNGDIIVTGGSLKAGGTDSTGSAYVIITGKADTTIDISGGIIEQLGSNSAVLTGTTVGGTINITGGTIIATSSFAVNNYIGTTTISGGTITSNSSRAVNCSTGSVTISDGIITGGTYGVYSTSGTVNVTGGTIKSGSYGIYIETGDLIIGTPGDGVNTTTPEIVGDTYGVRTSSSVISFYDGIIKGKTGAINTVVNTTETGYEVLNYTEGDYYVSKLVSSKTYGIKRNMTSSTSGWERIEDSVGLVANATRNGSVVQNSFDTIYPWSDIITYNYNTATNKPVAYYGDETFKFDGSNGEVLTKIPTFYIKVDVVDDYEYVYISATQKEGYTKVSEFSVGRYIAGEDSSGNIHSYSGLIPAVSKTGTELRTEILNLGTEFFMMDYRYLVLQYLYLVEYADYNATGVLGRGNVNLRYNPSDTALIAENNTNRFIVNTTAGNEFEVGQHISIGVSGIDDNTVAANRKVIGITDYNDGTISGKQITFSGDPVNIAKTNVIWSSAQISGGCDALGMRSGSLINNNRNSVIYRGVENPYGTVSQIIDGVNTQNGNIWICTDPENYSFDTFTSPYKKLNYTLTTSVGYITKLGFDSENQLFRFPIEAGTGSSTTYITDEKRGTGSGNGIIYVGGSYSGNANGFYLMGIIRSTTSTWSVGTRIMTQ